MISIFQFSEQNRIEVTMNNQGLYDCFINYEHGDNAWGTGTHCLEAIEKGVVNFLKRQSQQYQQTIGNTPIDIKSITHFFSVEALFFWYYFACKYNLEKIKQQYELQCDQEHPGYKNILQFITQSCEDTISDINITIHGTPAVYNPFVQAVVYYESQKRELYENNKAIMDIINKQVESEREGFFTIQKKIVEVDEAIQSFIHE
jgi:hypothetical protein